MRKLRKISLENLGVLAGYNISSAGSQIAQYQSNYKTPRLDQQMNLAKVLEIDYRFLFSQHEIEIINVYFDMIWELYLDNKIEFLYSFLGQIKKYDNENYHIVMKYLD